MSVYTLYTNGKVRKSAAPPQKLINLSLAYGYSSGLGSLLYFSTSLQSKKVLGKSNEVQVKSTLLENYLSKK